MIGKNVEVYNLAKMRPTGRTLTKGSDPPPLCEVDAYQSGWTPFRSFCV